MFKFSPLFFALALSQASAIRSGRELSEELFLTYEPQTTVTDHVRYHCFIFFGAKSDVLHFRSTCQKQNKLRHSFAFTIFSIYFVS